MIANVSKNNTGKLLVAVLAMAMIVAGVAVVFSDETQAADDAKQSFLDALKGDETVITLNESIELTSSDNGGTINLGGKTVKVSADKNINIDGANVKNGTIEGTATSMSGQYLIGMKGNSTLDGVDVIVNDDGGATPCAAILVFPSASASITGCDITGPATGFGAVQVQSNTTITGGTIGGQITYNVYDGSSSKLTIDGCKEVILNFPNTMSVNTSVLELKNEATVSETIIGWDSVSTNASVSSTENVDVTFDGTYDLGTVRAGDADNFTGTKAIIEGQNSNLTYVPDGDITVKDKDGSVTGTINNYQDLAEALGGESNNKAVEITVTGNIVLENDIYINSNQMVNFSKATVTQKTDGTGTIIVNDGILTTDDSYLYVPVKLSEDAQFSASNTHDLESNGTLNADTQVGFGDTLTLTGTVPENVNVKVFGTLITSDLAVNGSVKAYKGSTVSTTGTITVAGTFTVEDADMEIAGTITVRNDTNGGAKFVLNGESTVTILENGTVNVNRATATTAKNVNELTIAGTSDLIVEGTLNITGTLNGAIQDKGTVTFNGTAGTDASIVVYNEVNLGITSVTGNDLTITTDSADIIADYIGKETFTATDDEKASYGNNLVLNNVRGVTVSVTVTEESYDNAAENGKVRVYSVDMAVTGTVSKVTSAASGSIVINGDADPVTNGLKTGTSVAGAMTVGDLSLGRNLGITFNGVIDITGTLNANVTAGSNGEGITLTNSATSLTVSGTMVLGEGVNAINTAGLNAAYYKVTASGEGTGTTETRYYTNFANAIAAIGDADDDMVLIYGNVKVSADAEIADGMTVQVQSAGKLTITADAQLTVADGGVLDVSAGNASKKAVAVEGVLVVTNNGTGLTGSAGAIDYDVLKTVGNTDTYSSLTYALANSQAGETITLSKPVTLKTNTTIPEGVTLQTGRNSVTINEKVILTVNGTFAVQNGGSVVQQGPGDKKADIIVNGVMSVAGAASVDEMAKAYGISGAYYIQRNVGYITNVAYAAENVNRDTITIMGQVNAGDVTFTADNSGLTVVVQNIPESSDATVVSAGTITLDGTTFQIVSGTFTGTITAAANGSTASIDLSKAGTLAGKAIVIASDVDSTADGDVDVLYLNGYIQTGTVTIASGTVTVPVSSYDYDLVLNSNVNQSKGEGTIAVASGATLDFEESTETYIQVITGETDSTVMTVDGTVDLAGTLYFTSPVAVAGTINVNDNGNLSVEGAAGVLTVTGTVAVTEAEDETAAFTVKSVLVVGDKPTTLGATGAVGTITGDVKIDGTGYIKAYPGADLSAAKINWQDATEESTAVSTVFNINDAVYMTVYAASEGAFTIQSILNDEVFELAGYDVGIFYGAGSKDNSELYNVANWYTSAEMMPNQKVADKIGTEANASIYAAVEASYVKGTISEGTGLDLYIDNIRYDPNMDQFKNGLQVGTHTVSFEITSGYDGSAAKITFNGVEIQNGGTITIEAGATGFTLVANGAVPSTGQPVVVGGDSDGMSLTDILLIVLVVLILVMAIIVALRLMRS